MVDTVRLALARTDLNVVGEASLRVMLVLKIITVLMGSYPHCSVQRSSDFVVLVNSRAAPKDLGEPELADGALHMANLALGRDRCLDPLGWLPTHTTYHVGMSEGLWRSSLPGLANVQCRWERLCDPRMER